VGDFAVCAGDPGSGSSSSSHKNLNIPIQGNPEVEFVLDKSSFDNTSLSISSVGQV
jgi:hypothetical protein